MYCKVVDEVSGPLGQMHTQRSVSGWGVVGGWFFLPSLVSESEIGNEIGDDRYS
jgi:hypothetical protein